jgi:hypothetical protein
LEKKQTYGQLKFEKVGTINMRKAIKKNKGRELFKTENMKP